MKKALKRVITLMLAVCLSASLLAPAALADDGDEAELNDAPKITSLNLDNIYSIAYDGCVDAKIANQKLQIFYDEMDKLNDQIDAATALAGSSDPFKKLTGTLTFSSLVPNQITGEDKKIYELSVELSKRQIALGGRSMLIAFLNAQYQYEQLRLDLDRMKRDAATMKKMAELGMKSGLEQRTLEQSVSKLENSLNVIGDGVSKLKTQLAVYLDISSNLMEIEEFKGYTSKEAAEIVSAIDFSKDALSAKEQNLSLQIQKLKRDNSYSANGQLESLNYKKLSDQFDVDFESLYKNLLRSSASLKDAETASLISEDSYKFSKLKFSLGMISKIELDNSEAQYLSEGKKLASSKLKFSSAHYSYQAMLGGVWQQA